MACRDEAVIEVLVVDNNSQDGSCEAVAEEFPHVRLIRNSMNVGFAAANNQALRDAKGRYLLLLNSDTIVYPGAFRELIRFMDQHTAAGYCGPKLVNSDGTLQPSARRFPTLLSRTFSMTGLAQRYTASRHCLDLHGHHQDFAPFTADWLTGACLMVRRQAYEQVGLLDESYFMYFEETDWCRRMAQDGWEGCYLPAAKVMHLGGQSVCSERDDRVFSGDHPLYWVNSHRYYMRRHFGVGGMMFSEAIQIFLYVLLYLRYCWRNNDRSRSKARCASNSLRYLLVRTKPKMPARNSAKA